MRQDRRYAGGPMGDTPQLIRPGVMYAESAFSGNMSVITLEPDSPERLAKGDLGYRIAPHFESRYSFERGVGAPPPFMNMRRR